MGLHDSKVLIPQGLITILGKARSITFLTGAGISAESGIPTFREAQTGLWSRYNPLELASPQAFQRNPKLVWEWYQWRRKLISNAKPNPAHVAIANFEVTVPEFALITQNVDGLHTAAGNKDILELHGNIHRTKCFTENVIVEEWKDTGEVPPHCPNCGGFLRPDVVWYGEMLNQECLAKAHCAAKNSEVFFSVGTSSFVEPAASLPLIALDSGATLIEVNPQETSISKFANFIFRGAAGIILPEFARLVSEIKNNRDFN